MSTLRALLLIILAPAGCLLEPPTSDDGLTIEVRPRAADPRADGVGIADIVVRGDEAVTAYRESVELRVSSGALGAEGRADFRAAMPPSGELVVPMTYGRAPGPLVVEARIDGRAALDDSLDLAPSVPETVELSLAPSSISAFGGLAELTIGLGFVDGRARASWGSAVALRVCCVEDGALRTCAAPPVDAPARARLQAGDEAIRVPLAAVGGEGEPGTVEAVVLVAIGEAAPACRADAADAEARITVTR